MEFKRQKYMDALVERMHNGMIKVVTGIRRSGKSYLLFNLFVRYLMQQGTAMMPGLFHSSSATTSSATR